LSGAFLELEPVPDLQQIRGLAFAAGVGFRQLVVTGPPGGGKTTLIGAIGGWPEEGYLDLTVARWWRSRILTFRPREVHLGFPFHGHESALALFEKETVAAPEPLRLQPERIRLPGKPRRFNPIDWRRKLVFEFLLPPAEQLFEARRKRSYLQTHPVDTELSLEQTVEQLAVYAQVARLFHRRGLRVYVRDGFGVPPKRLSEPGPAATGQRGQRPRRSFLERSLKRLIRAGDAPVVEAPDDLTLVGKQVRIPRQALPLEIELGPQTLQIHLEQPLIASQRWPSALVVFDPFDYRERISGFVRLERGQQTRIGKGEEDRQISLRLPSDILPRLEIGYDGELLSLADLHSPTGTRVRSLAKGESRRLITDRKRRLLGLRDLVGGSLGMLEPGPALDCLLEVNRNLEHDPYRPLATDGLPGGLVELPDDLVPVIIGDLHANLDNLVKILAENRFVQEMQRGRAAVILLGDAVHREEESLLDEMQSSVVMMDFILRMMRALPGRFIYLRGNHDSFSHEVTKEGVEQGRLWRSLLGELRGSRYVEEMERFYQLGPYIAVSEGFIACHAGPPLESVSRQTLVDIRRHTRLMHQLTWNRLKRPGKPAGYSKRDVAALRKALGAGRSEALIVSHNPPSRDETFWLDVGGIKGHHMVYSANDDAFAVFTRIGGEMVPLEYRGEALSRFLEG
jgi:hypothetical protein